MIEMDDAIIANEVRIAGAFATLLDHIENDFGTIRTKG